MLKTSLRENIADYVKCWGCVSQQNIMQFFRNHSPQSIKWNVNSMIFTNILHLDEDGNICASHACPISFYAREARDKALCVLAAFGEEKVREYYIAKYPVQVLFITEDNNVYDITVYSRNNYTATRQLAPFVRRTQQIPGIDDEIIHIAIVPDVELIDEIAPVGYDSYCVIDSNGNPVYYN